MWDSVFFVSSFLPSSLVPSLASLCFFKLKDLPPTAQPSDYMLVLECLCNQMQGLEVLELLKEWISVGLIDSYEPPPPKKVSIIMPLLVFNCHSIIIDIIIFLYLLVLENSSMIFVITVIHIL